MRYAQKWAQIRFRQLYRRVTEWYDDSAGSTSIRKLRTRMDCWCDAYGYFIAFSFSLQLCATVDNSSHRFIVDAFLWYTSKWSVCIQCAPLCTLQLANNVLWIYQTTKSGHVDNCGLRTYRDTQTHTRIENGAVKCDSSTKNKWQLSLESWVEWAKLWQNKKRAEMRSSREQTPFRYI